MGAAFYTHRALDERKEKKNGRHVVYLKTSYSFLTVLKPILSKIMPFYVDFACACNMWTIPETLRQFGN